MQMYKKIISFIIPLVIILFAIYHRHYFISEASNLYSVLKNAVIWYVLIAILLYIISVYLFALRWKYVLKSLGYDIQSKQLVPIIFGGITINNLTPANRAGGEPLRMYWVKKQFNIGYKDVFISILYERLVEAVPILIMTACVFYTILPIIKNLKINFMIIIIVLIVLFILLFIFKNKIIYYIDTIKNYYSKLQKSFYPTLILSSAVWILEIIRLKCIMLSLYTHLPFKVIVSISLVYLVLGSIPLTTGGLGIVEGGLLSVLVFFGVPVINAAGIIVIERLISYILASLIGAVFLIKFGGWNIWRDSKLLS